MNLKINGFGLDQAIRIILGIVLVVLYLFGFAGGGLGVLLSILVATALITGIVGFCPLY
ncbi:MAG: DUF2892 domain-containing protein [Anaerolineaceae bacterium]|nr:DUF2892 domain-containing protein [Anaerolineaceae bacterium]MBN2676659.1 DUF2892 domain-containing protein [Anaerolineaceae bacterium]